MFSHPFPLSPSVSDSWARAADEKSKRPVKHFTEEERNPTKRLKGTAPDFTVVVGGVEFHHYKLLLCMNSPFFDNMMAAKMKETKDNQVEFPDKDPEEWLLVYSFLDPMSSDSSKVARFQALLPDGSYPKQDAFNLVTWLDFLGMERWVRKLDALMASHIDAYFTWNDLSPSDWAVVKRLPCPRVHKTTKAEIKKKMKGKLQDLSFVTSFSVKAKDFFVDYLLDSHCGDEMWQYLLSLVDFPPEVDKSDKLGTVSNPLFMYMLAHRGSLSTKHRVECGLSNTSERRL